jgi:Tol biopolymer transport system component
LPDIFVHDRATRRTERVSVGPKGRQANGDSSFSSISADGRFVAFGSSATNLVPADTNDEYDIFVHDRVAHRTERVSVGMGGRQAKCGPAPFGGFACSDYPTISANGRFVVFSSAATNLVSGDTNNSFDVFIHDRLTRRTERVSVGPKGQQAEVPCDLEFCSDSGSGVDFASSISADGRFVAFNSNATNLVPGDTNGEFDVFVRDRGR